MLKVTIYDGPGGSETCFIEGVTMPGGGKKVAERGILYKGSKVVIAFDNQERKVFHGFRYIVDKINDPQKTESQ